MSQQVIFVTADGSRKGDGTSRTILACNKAGMTCWLTGRVCLQKFTNVSLNTPTHSRAGVQKLALALPSHTFCNSQYLKQNTHQGAVTNRQSCLLLVDNCHGYTIVTSDSIIVTSEQHLYQTIVQFDKTIVLPRKLATGNIHDYLFCHCPLVGILFEVLRIPPVETFRDLRSQTMMLH